MKQLLHVHHTLRRQMCQALAFNLVRITGTEGLLAVLPIKELHTVPPTSVERRIESFVSGSHEFQSSEYLDWVEELVGEYLPTLINLAFVEYQLRGLGSANLKSVW